MVLRSLTPKHKPAPAPTFRCAATAAFSHSLPLEADTSPFPGDVGFVPILLI